MIYKGYNNPFYEEPHSHSSLEVGSHKHTPQKHLLSHHCLALSLSHSRHASAAECNSDVQNKHTA